MLYPVILCCLHTCTYSLYWTDGINERERENHILYLHVTIRVLTFTDGRAVGLIPFETGFITAQIISTVVMISVTV
jgi:hypothetical protein